MQRPTQIMMELIGGPYDGFSQILSDLEGDLAPEFEMPVQQNLIRVMSGQPRRPTHKVRTVAVYDLADDALAARYVFKRVRWANSAERPLFDEWCQQILESWQSSGLD